MSTLFQFLAQAEGAREAIGEEVDRCQVPEAGPLACPSSGPALLLVQPAQMLPGPEDRPLTPALGTQALFLLPQDLCMPYHSSILVQSFLKQVLPRSLNTNQSQFLPQGLCF